MKIRVEFDSYEEFNSFIAGGTAAVAVADPEPKPEPEPEPELKEDLLPVARKTLSALNKKTGKNTASNLIKELGFEKLTDVSADKLPALIAKAEEVLNG